MPCINSYLVCKKNNKKTLTCQLPPDFTIFGILLSESRLNTKPAVRQHLAPIKTLHTEPFNALEQVATPTGGQTAGAAAGAVDGGTSGTLPPSPNPLRFSCSPAVFPSTQQGSVGVTVAGRQPLFLLFWTGEARTRVRITTMRKEEVRMITKKMVGLGTTAGVRKIRVKRNRNRRRK